MIKKTIASLSLIILFMGFGFGVWIWRQWQSPKWEGQDEVIIEIESGSGVSQIAELLEQENLIKSPLIFKLVVQQQGLSQKLQAGYFVLSPPLTPAELARQLTQARQDQVSVTLLEGWRQEEVLAEIARSFAQLNRDFDQELFLSQPGMEEGRFYPDTYFLDRVSTEITLAQAISNNFQAKIEPYQDQIDQSALSLNQILTLASIIERETRVDRPLVAGILLNRLDLGMPLQVDASLQYIKGYDALEQTWWPEPLAADKDLASEYNTYMYPGLPPAPIANPSISAIVAVLEPASTEYLYYLTGLDGQMYYAQSYEQHLTNINRHLR